MKRFIALVLSLVMALSLCAPAWAEGETVTVADADQLVEALEAGKSVVFANDITINPANMSNAYGTTGINVKQGQTIDGGNFTLNIGGAGGTWDSGINTTGGTIKNITVTGSFRGIFINHNSDYAAKVILENVTTTGTTYTISCDQGTNNGFEATNCYFYGWTSFAATLGDATFTNCYFGEGSGYSFMRPYAPTKFVGCSFEAGYEMDPRAVVTFENCTIGDELITNNNLATLVTSNIANASVATAEVSFDANNGTGEMESVTLTSGETYTLPECGFTAPKDMRFKGWATSADATEVLGATHSVIEDTTFYAVWEEITYTVTFDASGGTGEMKNVTAPVGAYTLPKCTFTAPANMQFKAWRVSGVEYAEGDEIDVTADVTVTAVWKDVEKCTGDSHLKVVVEYSGEKATKVYCDSCGMTFAFVQGTEDDAKNEFGAGNYKNAEKDVWYSLKTQSGEAPVVPPVEDEPVEIPVSGEDGEGIVVEAIISGTTATIEKMDELDKVIGEDADTGTVTINLSGVKGTVEDAESGESTEVPIDTVEIPTEVVKNIADAVASSNNDAESLEIILGGGVSIEFDADALANKVKKAEGEKITISVKLATDESAELNDAQKETVGESKAFDISVTSDNNNLFSKDSKDKGTITLGVPYALGENEKAEGVVVYYVDEDGNREECDTVYDEETCRVTWVTNHLSIYMIGYEEPSVPGDGNNGGITRPSITTPSTDKTVKSADTFDAGIALYVGMSIVAAAGSAVVIGKKKEF